MPKSKTALVTGAGGFIGRHLVREMIAQNINVVALLLPTEPVPEEWGDQVKVVTGDIRELEALTDTIGAVDQVFHLAAVVSDWGAMQHHIDITVSGTEQAISLALKNNAVFVVTTSVCSYASNLASGKISESTPLGKPASSYEFCKQEQERVTQEAVKNHNLKATIVRPGNVYGVGSGPWVHTMLDLMNQNKPCLMGSGDWDAGLCHVNNLVALMLAAADSNTQTGEIYNAADGFGVTWKTYLQRLAKIAGAPEPKPIPNALAKYLAPVFVKVGTWMKLQERPAVTQLSYRLAGGPNQFCIEKARKNLNYQPRVSYEQAMGELAEHFGYTGTSETQDWVWVTGSASGLGRHLTGQLLQKGYRVLASDLSQQALEKTATEDNWNKDSIRLKSFDVTDLQAWQKVFTETQEQGMRFSHLLNVAGIIRPGYSFENPAQEVGLQLQVNTMGSVNGCDTLLPHFKANQSGHIINIASFAGFGSVPGVVGYAASKAAIRSFSNGLAQDLHLAGSNIKVSCVCPDLIATPMLDHQVGFGEHSRMVFSGNRPLTTEEVGSVILGEVWDKQPMEIAIPKLKGIGIRVIGMMPATGLKIFDYLGKRGIKNLQKARADQIKS